MFHTIHHLMCGKNGQNNCGDCTKNDTKRWDSILFRTIACVMWAITFFPIVSVLINSPIAYTGYTCESTVKNAWLNSNRQTEDKNIEYFVTRESIYLCQRPKHIDGLRDANDRPLKKTKESNYNWKHLLVGIFPLPYFEVTNYFDSVLLNNKRHWTNERKEKRQRTWPSRIKQQQHQQQQTYK